MNLLFKFFLRGLLVIVPLFLSLYVIFWFFSRAEHLALQGMNLLGLNFYFPGMGILVGMGLIILVGIIMSSIVAQRLHQFLQNIISKMPILKTIYFAIADFLNFFAGTEEAKNTKVVLVQMPNHEAKLVGILTNLHPEALISIESTSLVAVYLPMSYQIGGYTVFIPKSWITETNLSVEDAVKLSMTGWIKKVENANSNNSKGKWW